LEAENEFVCVRLNISEKRNHTADIYRQSIVALTRPSSITKPANGNLKDRGVEIRPFDLSGPEEPLVEALRGIDVLISAIAATDQNAQIPLATVAKKAQVKRFVPCAFITVAPPGRMMLRDWVS